MLNQKSWLQLFAEGGDGGSAGESTSQSGVGGQNSENDAIEIPSSIPERARKLYVEVARKHRSADVATTNKTSQSEEDPSSKGTTVEESAKPAPTPEPSFEELIGNEKFKKQREEYLSGIFKNRFSKIEKELSEEKRFLAQIAGDLGVDPNSANLLSDLKKAYRTNDDRVRQYAQDHDMPEPEARRFLEMQEQLSEAEADRKTRERVEEEIRQQEAMRQQIEALQASAERTKARFPGFDLRKELENERFSRICAATGGDTTTAYIATHHEEIFDRTVKAAAETAKQQVSQAVAANQARPQENGLNQVASSTTEINFSGMNLAQLRAWAADNLRKSGG